MATFYPRSRAGAADLAMPLMLVSFAVIAGFLYWLSIEAANATPVVVAEEEQETGVAGAQSMTTFSDGLEGFLGQEVSVRAVPVISGVGPNAFLTSLRDANETAFLMHFGPGVLGEGAAYPVGGVVDVTGVVVTMSDSILNDWEAAGSFPGPADRLLAEFAETFLELSVMDEVSPSTP